MSYQIKNGSTDYPLVFMMVDSTDHVTGKTALSPTVTISKAGAAFASPAGAVTEIGSGWYKVAGNATDSGTLGPLILHATATGADPTDTLYEVVAYDPQDTVRLGLTAMPNVASGSAGAIITSGTGTAQLKTTAGIVDLPSITAGWLTAAGIAAGALNGKGDWNIGKTGYSLTQSFPANFSALAITVGGAVTVGTNSDKTGYSLAQAFPANFASLSISTTTGLVDITQSAADKVWDTTLASHIAAGSTGAALNGASAPSASTVANAVWDVVLSGHLTAGSTGFALNAAGSAGDPWGTALPGAYGAGSAGYIVGNNLNAKVGDVKTKTDFLPSATAGAAGGVFIAGTNAATTVNITGNLSGSVGSVTTVSDKTGYSLSAPGVQAIWDALTSAFTAAGSVGKRIADFLTGDAFVRLGAPVGASTSADIAAVKSDTAAALTRLPAALVGGRMDSNMSSINNTATTFNAFERAVKGNVIGTVGIGSTTTSIVTSLVTPAPSVADQLKGRLITFADDTTTVALRGQSTDIVSNTASATPAIGVTALTTAPVSTDRFSIT